MKASNNTLFAILLVTASLVFAQGVTAATDKPAQTPEAGAAGMATMPMQQQMQSMQEQMMKMHETTDPQERQALMKEHMQSMQGMMQMMHGMMPGQGGMGARHGGMMGSGNQAQGMMNRPCADGTYHDRMAGMEKRMNAMQMMMDQMLKSQSEQLDKE